MIQLSFFSPARTEAALSKGSHQWELNSATPTDAQNGVGAEFFDSVQDVPRKGGGAPLDRCSEITMDSRSSRLLRYCLGDAVSFPVRYLDVTFA